MSQRLETVRETATRMPERWGLRDPITHLDFHGPLSAMLLDAQPAEVWAEPSEAHIVSFILSGERRHRMWHDSRPIFDGPLPLRANIVPAGVRPTALVTDPLRVLHVYIPASHLVSVAEAAGAGSAAQELQVIDPLFRPDPQFEAVLQGISGAVGGDVWADRLLLDTLGAALSAYIIHRWSSLAGSSRLRSPAKGGLSPHN